MALLRRALREPVVHFLALGLLVFFVDAQISDERADARILVSEADVARIADLWERQWRRPPTDAELRNLLADHVREEILYREALRMGLDEDDTVIRRRLAQKIAFLSEDRAVRGAPPVAELEDYFETHRDRYRRPPRITLRQIPFTRGEDAQALRAAALEALEELGALEEDEDAAMAGLGHASMLPRRVERWTPRELAGEFGAAFVDAIDARRVGVWQGPLGSAFGQHLVRIEAYEPEADATFEAARREIERDWLDARREAANEAFYAELQDRYEVDFELGRFAASDESE